MIVADPQQREALADALDDVAAALGRLAVVIRKSKLDRDVLSAIAREVQREAARVSVRSRCREAHPLCMGRAVGSGCTCP